MKLFMVELTVSKFARSLEWYREFLERPEQLLDEANDFALFECGACRIALKSGTPRPGSTKVVFEIVDLPGQIERLGTRGIAPTSPIARSAEGYRSVRFLDPDAHPIELFEFTGPTAPIPSVSVREVGGSE